MIFITYWELNPDFDPSDLAGVAQTLISKKIWPVEGTKEIAWYVSVSDYWGITILEAETEEQLKPVARKYKTYLYGMKDEDARRI